VPEFITMILVGEKFLEVYKLIATQKLKFQSVFMEKK
jgi:hypothetical protein